MPEVKYKYTAADLQMCYCLPSPYLQISGQWPPIGQCHKTFKQSKTGQFDESWLIKLVCNRRNEGAPRDSIGKDVFVASIINTQHWIIEQRQDIFLARVWPLWQKGRQWKALQASTFLRLLHRYMSWLPENKFFTMIINMKIIITSSSSLSSPSWSSSSSSSLCHLITLTSFLRMRVVSTVTAEQYACVCDGSLLVSDSL